MSSTEKETFDCKIHISIPADELVACGGLKDNPIEQLKKIISDKTNVLKIVKENIAELFEKPGRQEDKLYCECRAYECGLGLMSYYDESERVAAEAMNKQVELGRRLTKVYVEKEGYDKAFYFTDANMGFLIPAKGIVSADKIDALFKLVLQDREEISKR